MALLLVLGQGKSYYKIMFGIFTVTFWKIPNDSYKSQFHTVCSVTYLWKKNTQQELKNPELEEKSRAILAVWVDVAFGPCYIDFLHDEYNLMLRT